MLYFLRKTIQVRSEIAEEDEEDEELNVKKMKSKQKDKYVNCVIALPGWDSSTIMLYLPY